MLLSPGGERRCRLQKLRRGVNLGPPFPKGGTTLRVSSADPEGRAHSSAPPESRAHSSALPDEPRVLSFSVPDEGRVLS